ncbi:MAG: PAS domain S-box protein [Bacteroidales bacterium]|nr:PAS domain S-box protein [Bacteroidales bacterium]
MKIKPFDVEQLVSFNLLSVVGNSIIAIDLVGNIIYWNKGAEKIFGYKQNEILGKSLQELYPDKNKQLFFDDIKKIQESDTIKIEWEGRNKKDQTIWVELTATKFKNNQNKTIGYIGISEDITKSHEKIKYKSQLSNIIEYSEDGIVSIDLDGFITSWNKGAAKTYGYTKKEILGKNIKQIYPEENKKELRQIIKIAKQGKKIKSFETKRLHKNGNTLNVNVNYSPVKDENNNLYGLSIITRDLTEFIDYQHKLKEKTEKLLTQNKEILNLNKTLNEKNESLRIINSDIEESEKKFRVAFKTSLDAITISEFKTGTYIEINAGFTRLTGYEEHEVLGKTSIELNLWKDDNERKRLINELKKNKRVFDFETQFQNKNGKTVTCITSANIIDIKGKNHIISISRDISERKENELKLKQAIKQAEESDMLKSAFLANMSHEIRTPMNAILGFSQLLKEKKIEPKKQDKFLDIIVSRAKNLLQIINDIIDISKIEANQLHIDIHEFSLKKMLYEVYSFFEAEIFANGKKNLKLKFNALLNNYTNFIKSDEVRLKQILTNLISNAIKFTEKGNVEFGYNLRGNYLEFFVRDTGLGISKDSQKYIFDRFRQADNSITREFGGTGLGLSISKQLVEKLGGKIWFNSQKEKGTEFYFTTPFVPVKKLKQEEINKKEKLLDLDGITIMIVEDDLISITYLEELLMATNAKIIKANDGNIAIKKFKENPDIDIILMDVHLPYVSGNEATQIIKKIKKTVPIIMQSAYAMPNDKQESFKCGCDDYITKPVDARVLMFTLKKYLM